MLQLCRNIYSRIKLPIITTIARLGAPAVLSRYLDDKLKVQIIIRKSHHPNILKITWDITVCRFFWSTNSKSTKCDLVKI